MNNFLIGFYGKVDEEKYKSDFIRGFYGVEACMFPNIEEVQKLYEKSKEEKFSWGVHYPLIQKKSITRDPLFISLDEKERNEAFDQFEREVEIISKFEGKYILTHFPKPVLVNETLDLSYWRFANDREWTYAKDYPIDELNNNLEEMFRRLDRISKRHNLQIVLENDAICSYLSESSILEELFKKFNNIKACLDIGRLHLQQTLDSKFNGYDFARKLAPYTFIIHLWNTSPQTNLTGGHLPVSPNQTEKDGFGNVEKYLNIILSKNPDVKILFEHKSSHLSRKELHECYNWVQSIQQRF